MSWFGLNLKLLNDIYHNQATNDERVDASGRSFGGLDRADEGRSKKSLQPTLEK